MTEREVFLPEETDNNRNNGNNHLGRGGVESDPVNEQFESEIVDSQVDNHDDDVSPQLACTMESGLGEGDIFIEPKTCQEGDGKDYTESHYVGRDAYLGQPEQVPTKRDIHQIVSHYEVVHHKIQHPIQQHITTPAGGIAKELFGDISAERSVEKINDFSD